VRQVRRDIARVKTVLYELGFVLEVG